MFRRFEPPQLATIEIIRVEDLIRAHFSITEYDLVLVSEDHSAKPGYPIYETNVVFWISQTRYRIKFFKRLAEVDLSDLPIRWLLPMHEDNGDNDCC